MSTITVSISVVVSLSSQVSAREILRDTVTVMSVLFLCQFQYVCQSSVVVSVSLHITVIVIISVKISVSVS